MENTGISWAHDTQNFWEGCNKVAPECAHCYIDRIIRKHPDGENGFRQPWGKVYRMKTTWDDPRKWEREAKKANHALRVFTCSLSDFFHDKGDPWRKKAWDIIRYTPHLVWLILTKRPALIESRLPADWGEGYKNVWLGVSTGCNARLKQMDVLRKIPAALRWVSTEPLLEDISQQINLDGFHWVVTGGESGSGKEYLWEGSKKHNWREEFKRDGRRAMMLKWAENLRDKTKAAGLPFMFKQVTATRSGQGVNALGQVWHEFPPAPNGMVWAPRNPIAKKHFWTQAQIEKLRTEQNQRKSGRK